MSDVLFHSVGECTENRSTSCSSLLFCAWQLARILPTRCAMYLCVNSRDVSHLFSHKFVHKQQLKHNVIIQLHHQRTTMTTQALLIEMWEEVTSLNNEGVHCLLLSDAGAARHRFKAALAMVNSQLGAHDGVLDVGAATGVVAGNPQLASFAIPGMNDDCFYVHNQALIFRVGVLGSFQDVNMASSILVFNLALSYHLVGMASNSESNLRAACRLYVTCAKLALTSDTHMVGSALAVASMNNMAQIEYRLLADPGKALEILNGLQLCHELGQTTFMDPLHIDEIVLNIICASRVSATPAASAA
jgi:hypothetical protein